MEKLHSYIEKKLNLKLNEDDFHLISPYFTKRTLLKRQYLLQSGNVSNTIAFVCSGCLRMFKVDEVGVKHITQFAIENWWICDRGSAETKIPSSYNIDANEDSELLVIDYVKAKELISRSPIFANLIANATLHYSISLEKRVDTFISFKAEEKYANFIRTYPSFINRIPLHMIASFLGLTPETLSRIRKQFIE